jgi:hypothetical protein
MNMELLKGISAELTAHRKRFSRAVEMLSCKSQRAHRAGLAVGEPYQHGDGAAEYFEATLRDLAQRVYDCAERYRRAGAQHARGCHPALYILGSASLEKDIELCLRELRGEI